METTTGLRGEVTIEVFGPDGQVKSTTHIRNKVVNTGVQHAAQRMMSNTTPVASHIGVGTGGNATEANMTALQTPAGARVASVTPSLVTKNIPNDAVQYVATFPPGNPGTATALQEAGLFNASTGGTMIARTTFPVVNKGVDDGISITWKLWNEAL